MSIEDKFIVEFIDADIYQGNTIVLNKINFRLAKAETCYIVGKSGSGKTSFLKTIYGTLPLKSGVGKVVGFDLMSLESAHLYKLRRNLGMVFQDFNLFLDWTIGRNLLYVLEATGWKERTKMVQRVLEVLEMVGLSGMEKKSVTELSGGEQQRVVIARALLNNPPLIVADEPTGNLDPENSDSILYLLNGLSRDFGTSIIIATHDYRLIDKFPARIYKCDEGTLQEV